MKKFIWFLILPIAGSPSCATLSHRFLIGAGSGAVVSGGTATLLSPNSESRGMNALVFGLAGAVAGGALAILAAPSDSDPATTEHTLKTQELLGAPGASSFGNDKLYSVSPSTQLPSFVKERLQPVVIEEATEPDSVSDDGTLHEPHKVYRIQKNAELFALPPEKKADLSHVKEAK